MSTIAAIETAYRHIYTDQNPVPAFVDLMHGVREAKPDAAQIATCSIQEESARRALYRTRSISVQVRGESAGPRFLPNGIAILGDERCIIGVDAASLDNDPVARHYGPYQHVALGKLGMGALALRFAGRYPQFADRYFAIDGVLAEHQLKTVADEPHHIGYAYSQTPSGIVVAAASGMLAGSWAAERLADKYGDVIERDVDRGWLSWQGDSLASAGDTFAGYHDQVFAESAIDSYRAKGQRFVEPSLDALANAGVNLH